MGATPFRIEVQEVSVINPNETAKNWKTSKREHAVQIFLSGVDGGAGELVGTRIAGFPLALSIVPSGDAIDADALAGAAGAVIQVDVDNPASVKRFEQLAAASDVPLIAAAYEPPLALVRSLVRAGAHDVIPLPLTPNELEIALAPVREALSKRENITEVGKGKLVSIIKSVGGVGATALLGQLAIRFAENEGAQRRETCLVDLDVQFGDAAFQLGLQPKLSLFDLLEAGTRLDGALLRATTTPHASGLKVIAAPFEMMPLEAVSSEHVLQIVDLATREFGTVFVDLPTNWTNWSLSLVARSDLVLLVTELTVAGLARARRQLDLLDSQDLENLDIRVVVNRYEKALARNIRPVDVQQALGRDAAFNIANDFALMRAAIDRGAPVGDIKRKSALGKDLDALDAGIAAVFGLER
jgi:pilus assembly protein CpaE